MGGVVDLMSDLLCFLWSSKAYFKSVVGSYTLRLDVSTLRLEGSKCDELPLDPFFLLCLIGVEKGEEQLEDELEKGKTHYQMW